MDFKTEQDVTGATWLVAGYKRNKRNIVDPEPSFRESWRIPLRRLHEISNHENGLELVLVTPSSGGKYTRITTKSVRKDDKVKFFNALFPKQSNSGPYR